MYKNDPDSRQKANRCYKEGLLSLKKGSLVQAEICFKQALQQAEPFAPALEGMARVYSRRNQINLAEQYLEASVQADKNWIPAYILKGQILLQKEDYDLALEELKQAEARSRAHQLFSMQKNIQPLLADAYAGTGNFNAALLHYKKAQSQNPDDKTLQQKINATERSLKLVKGRGRALQKIILQKTVSRSDIALLLIDYLPAYFMADTLRNELIRDLPVTAPRAQAIEKTVRAGLLPLLPDGTFRPSDRVDRAEAALFMEHILKEKHTGFQQAERGNFKDVEFWQPYIQAAVLAVSLKLIPAGNDGYFFPKRYVSGREAVEMIYRLAEILQLPSFPAHLLRNKSPEAEHD